MLLEPGFPKDEMFVESETEFFSKTYDVQIRFATDTNGVVNSMIVYQGDSTPYEVVNTQRKK